MITLAHHGRDATANAAVKWSGVEWIRDHRAANGLALVRPENVDDRYAEERRADVSLTRFTIARSGLADDNGRPPPTDLTSMSDRSHRHSSAKWWKGV
ncbi:hypothetical protein ACFVIM_00410 [Streptomyces sp. NPDC057638]|uniref:hypothetical protein n=1 Tax=Streptomyces sp. NPDC057638 TaxID=3346190 RepID=UPI0036809D2A